MTHKIIKTIARNILIICMILNTPTLFTTPFIYVANQNGYVSVIDAATNASVTTVRIPALSAGFIPSAYCIAAAPNGTTACVGVNQMNSSSSSIYASTIAIINASLRIPVLINTATLISPTLTSLRTTCVAYTIDSNSVYVGVNTGTSPSLIFPVTNLTGSPTVGTPIPVPDAATYPAAIAIAQTSNGQTAYIVTNAADLYYMYIPGNTPVTINTTGITATFFSGIVFSPDAKTAYALGGDGSNALIYTIDTNSNTVTNLLAPIMISGAGAPDSITTDGTYLYVTEAGRNFYTIPINNPTMITSVSLSLIGQPQSLTLTPDDSTAYIAYKNGMVSSFPVPAGSPASPTTSLSLGGSTANNSITALPLAFPPALANGCKTKNVFLLQTDYINNITWTAPKFGTPVAYAIYRDSALTQLVSILPASGPLQYYDHGRNPNVTDTYYIVSINALGYISAPIILTVRQNC